MGNREATARRGPTLHELYEGRRVWVIWDSNPFHVLSEGAVLRVIQENLQYSPEHKIWVRLDDAEYERWFWKYQLELVSDNR